MTIGLRERKKARAKEQIVSKTIELIRERGYNGTTVEEISRQVEITTPTFYNYFAGKEAVLGHVYAEQTRAWSAVIDEHASGSESTTDKLGALASTMATEMLDDSELWRAVLVHGDINSAVNGSLREAERLAEGSLGKIFHAGQSRGELRNDYPAELLQAVHDGAYMAMTYGWAMGEIADDELKDAFLAVLDICLHGMSAAKR